MPSSHDIDVCICSHTGDRNLDKSDKKYKATARTCPRAGRKTQTRSAGSQAVVAQIPTAYRTWDGAFEQTHRNEYDVFIQRMTTKGSDNAFVVATPCCAHAVNLAQLTQTYTHTHPSDESDTIPEGTSLTSQTTKTRQKMSQ